MCNPSRLSLSSRFEPSSAQQVLATVVPAEMSFMFTLNMIYKHGLRSKRDPEPYLWTRPSGALFRTEQSS